MAGVDNILKEILQEAQTKADGLLSEAKSKADEILQSSAQADEKMAEIVSGTVDNTMSHSEEIRTENTGADSASSGNTGKDNNRKNEGSVKTGDAAPIAVIIAIMLIALSMIVVIYRKKSNK